MNYFDLSLVPVWVWVVGYLFVGCLLLGAVFAIDEEEDELDGYQTVILFLWPFVGCCWIGWRLGKCLIKQWDWQRTPNTQSDKPEKEI